MPPGDPRRRAATALAGSVGLLIGVNVLGNLFAPSWTYVPLNVAAAALLIVFARAGGAGDSELGLRRDRVRRGLLVGAAAAGAMTLLVAAGALIPWTRSFFEDERAAGVGIAGLLYQAVVRIPLGTALFEEVAFRGVVFGLGLRLWPMKASAAVSAFLFGLWHVLPALDVAEGNAGAGDIPTAAMAIVAVLSTAIAGLVFVWVRLRAGSLIAPVLMHAATNAAAFTAAWFVLEG